MANKRMDDKEGWYNRIADGMPKNPETSIKITPKAKGQLADGYNKLEMPKEKLQGHMQTKSERSKVGGPWKRKGRK